MKRLVTPLIAVLLGTLLFSGLLLVDFYKSLDSRFYDLLLRIRPAVEESEDILLLEVDDLTYDEIHVYPLPRDVFADGLILMKEFEPAWTIVDVEFVDGSEKAFDESLLTYTIPSDIELIFSQMSADHRQLVEDLAAGRLSRNAALNRLEELEDLSREDEQYLKSLIDEAVFSRDEHLGKAIAYVGDIMVTVNMTEDEIDQGSKSWTEKQEARDFIRSNRSINEYLTLEHDPFGESVEIQPSIGPVVSAAAWAGFPRMHIDPDGVRRRVDVIYKQGGLYYTHMGFGTWWYRQGQPPITVRKGSMTVGDVEIPLDEEGKMLITWPKRLYDGTPLNRKAAASYDASNPEHRLSFLYLYEHKLLWEELALNVGDLEYYGVNADTWGGLAQPLSGFMADLDARQAFLLDSGDGSQAGSLGTYRDQFLTEAAAFLNGDAEQEYLWALEDALSAEGLSDEEYNSYVEAYQNLPAVFEECRYLTETLMIYRDFLRSRIDGSTVVVGYTGTSTTDYGANPFERKYMNMGIYGAVYNSFVQKEFLVQTPLWLTALLTLGAGIVMALAGLIAPKRTSLNISSNILLLLLIWAAASLVFIFPGIYVHLLPIILVTLMTLITSQINNYAIVSKERSRIQSAFSQVISPDLVRQLQDNPELLQKRGDNRIITAMFTDIEAFSTISEHLNSPERIIDLLERYLTPMSDIILDEGGTIDKYEGDAIIAFWNAPVEREDHVHRACRAAMRMIEKEAEIHEELVKDGIWTEELVEKLRARGRSSDIHKPHEYLYTRIGINTGVNNVGFIGTAPRGGIEGRKDYTALGDGMNLAARLEGVNKQYGTQVLISGSTEEVIHNHFITRRLDRIRVVGKEDVIPLYELSYFKKFPEHYYPEEHDRYRDYYAKIDQTPYHNSFSTDERQCFNYYRDAQDLFQKKDWKGALELFDKILETMPDDGPTLTFRARCQGYIKKAPPSSWDGVYRMEFK